MITKPLSRSVSVGPAYPFPRAPPILLASENETEVSFFNRDAYKEYKLNPEVGLSTGCVDVR